MIVTPAKYMSVIQASSLKKTGISPCNIDDSPGVMFHEAIQQ